MSGVPSQARVASGRHEWLPILLARNVKRDITLCDSFGGALAARSVLEVKEVENRQLLSGQSAHRAKDCGDAASGRVHSASPNSHQVLTAVPGGSGEVRRSNRVDGDKALEGSE